MRGMSLPARRIADQTPAMTLFPSSPAAVAAESDGDGDNITDWCLEQFGERYGAQVKVTKDDIWEYLYGVMHAPDWREKYAHDLQRSLPRVPLADDFEAFRAAGRKLMDLHVNYETVDEHPDVVCLVDGEPDEGGSAAEAYRIDDRMRWGRNPDPKKKKRDDRTTLEVNVRCKLTSIPLEAHDYKVSGRSPLEWAVDSLRRKEDKASGIVDDPNGWHRWEHEPFELIRHLRRLTYLGAESARIIGGLPPSLGASCFLPGDEPAADGDG